MEDVNAAASLTPTPVEPRTADRLDKDAVVSTHVLVAEEQVDQLRELSRRTRVAQSEYLREAVDDLLAKYTKGPGTK